MVRDLHLGAAGGPSAPESADVTLLVRSG